MSRLTHCHIPFLVGVLFLMAAASPGQASYVFSDPAGDTFGTPFVPHDIASAETTVTAAGITFVLSFLGDIAPASDFSSANNLLGYIDIDTDQNSSTGAVANQTLYSPNGPSGLGIEYYVDLFSEALNPGYVSVVDASTGFPTGIVPITFSPRAFSLTISLALLGGDDGDTNYGVIVGDYVGSSDEITNFGLAPAFSRREPTGVVPEPSSLIIWSLIVALAIGIGGHAGRSVRSPK